MPPWQSRRFTPQRSRSTTKRLRADLPAIDWPARFQKWDERTIIDGAHNPGCSARARRNMARNFWRSERAHWSSRFCPTKICAASAKRSRQLLIQFFFRKFAANAQLIQEAWRTFWQTLLLFVGQALRLPATPKAFGVALQFPSLHLSVKRSSSRARNQIQF